MSALCAVVLLTLGGTPAETLVVRTVPALPAFADAVGLGEPAVALGEGRVRVWLARAGDTVAVYAWVRDSTASVMDELVVSLDMEGDRAATPQHDDFQWRIRRVLDSSVVYRGRGGRWQPPLDDPEWRLGAERKGGGWRVEALETAEGWRVLLLLHAAMFAGDAARGRSPGLGLRVYDGNAGGWYAWPAPREGEHPTAVERAPGRWGVVTGVGKGG